MKKLLGFLLVLIANKAAAQVGALGDLPITGQAAQTALINNIIPTTASSSATYVLGYRSLSCQVVSTGTAGAFIFEGSNDNTTWSPIVVYNNALLTGVPITAAITATASGNTYYASLLNTYVRLRISTAITGGSIQAFTRLMSIGIGSPSLNVSQPTAANLNATVQPGNTANTTAWLVGLNGRSTNGNTTVSLNSAATTNATLVKASAGNVYGVCIMNTSAAIKYVRFFNKASAPTVGTDVPIVVIAIPAGQSIQTAWGLGFSFSTGIAYAITNAATVLDATAVAAGDVQLSINYQ